MESAPNPSGTWAFRNKANPDLAIAGWNGSVTAQWLGKARPDEQWYYESLGFDFNILDGKGQSLGVNGLAPGEALSLPGANVSWKWVGEGQYKRIAPYKRTDLFVSIRGGSQYSGTPLVLEPYNTNGFQEWEKIPTDSIPEPVRKDVLIYDQGYVINMNSDRYVIGTDTQHYLIMEKWAYGYSFRHPITNRYLAYGGVDKLVISPGMMSIESVWLFDHLHDWGAIRPYLNPSATLHVKGGRLIPNAELDVWRGSGTDISDRWILFDPYLGGPSIEELLASLPKAEA